MTSKTKIIIGSAVGGVVLLGGIGTLAQGNSDSSTSYPDDYIYTIDELCSRADTERNFGNKHSDEIFTISGTIDRTSYKSVYFESNVDKSSYSKYQLECEFDDQDTVKALSENDTVTISGKLYHLILSEVTLKDCTLISVDSSGSTSEETSSTSLSSEENTSTAENQPTESSAQNSSASSESSGDISKLESSDVESSNSSSNEPTVEPPQSSTETESSVETTPSSSFENHFNDYSNPEQQNTTEYVLNTHTHKVHFASCDDVATIKSENYATTTDLQSVINEGYTACGHCHPF